MANFFNSTFRIHEDSKGLQRSQKPPTTYLTPHCEWREVPGFQGYGVTIDGVVYSRFWGGQLREGFCRILKPFKDKDGYLRVRLNSTRPRGIHYLVLTAFVGPCPEGLEGCHNNGDSGDNRLENLRWDTTSSNATDRMKHGTQYRPFGGSLSRNAKVTAEQVLKIRELYAQGGISYRRLGKRFNVTNGCIRKIISGKSWGHVEAKPC